MIFFIFAIDKSFDVWYIKDAKRKKQLSELQKADSII